MKMRISRGKFVLLIIMSLIGMTASGFVYYVYEIAHHSPPFCTSSYHLGPVAINCIAVLSSQYNNFHGINLDLLAIVYFFVNIALVFAIAFGSESVFRRSFDILFVWRFIGLLIVPYLMTIEFVVLKAICLYCTIMHVAILVDFAIVTYFLFWKDITHQGEVEEKLDATVPAAPSAKQ